ncbi:MAG TPA: acyltransferase [Microbacteriaceae bacterium]|nr:acyltransferase [Microbacteriaceae bacterium]
MSFSKITDANRSKTIRSIQVLRAVGASVVVYYHSVDAGGKFNLPSTGAWGVDLFFVISGFVIGMIAVRNTKMFFLRRVFRVVPLYFIATFAWATAVLLLPARADSTEVTYLGLIKSLLFIPYQMPKRDGPILQLGWTLNYEMFFYLLVALALLLMRKSNKTLVLVFVLLATIVASGYLWPSSNYIIATYQSPILLEFLAGVLISVLYLRGVFPQRVSGRLTSFFIVSVSLILAIVSFWLLIAQDTAALSLIASHRAFYYGVPAVALVISALMIEPFMRDGVITKILLELGEASYAMYLFHPFVAVFLSEIVLARFIETSNVPFRIMLFLFVYTSVALVSVVINRWLDQPMQNALRMWSTNRKKVESTRKFH